jgi:hypothetical protein
MKNILHLFTFGLTFVVSLSLVVVVKSFKGLSTAEKITNVLTEDISNGTSRRENFSNGRYYLAQKTESYVSASESINVEGLPEDFQNAWQEHMQAWRIHANYLNENKCNRWANVDYDRASNEQIREINQTWYEVLRIARQNGAVIPANAYY